MAVTAYMYGKAFANLLGGETSGETSAVDYLSDTIKVALCTSSYAYNLDTHEFFSDVTNEITGTGYTSGGATLGSKTITYTAANSWSPAAATTTAYVVGDIVRPSTGNGHLYRCIVAGTSGGSAPTWPTVSGQTVTDGTVTWAEIGRGITVIDAADPSWSTATLTARMAVVYKSTGTGSTSQLLCVIDFGADVSSTAATYQITLPSVGLFNFATP